MSTAARTGMIVEGHYFAGVVMRVDETGVKISWTISNHIQNYTWAQVAEKRFTFRKAIEPHNASDRFECTQCGHIGRDYVPGCKCCGVPVRLPHQTPAAR